MISFVCVCVCVCVCARVCVLSHVQFFVTPKTVALQVSLLVKFSRQEYWSGLLFPTPEDLLDPGPRDQAHVSFIPCIGRQILYHCTTWEAKCGIHMYVCMCVFMCVHACVCVIHK